MNSIENSPLLESIKAHGQEVLLLTDPVDEYFVDMLQRYNDKALTSAERDAAEPAKPDAEKDKEFSGLLNLLKTKLGDEVKEIRMSTRLKDSAAVLVADDSGPSAHMERLMARMGRGEEAAPAKRILELNPVHPLVFGLKTLAEKDATDSRIEQIGRLIYEQAIIAEGSKLKDPAGFARRMNDLLTKNLGN